MYFDENCSLFHEFQLDCFVYKAVNSFLLENWVCVSSYSQGSNFR